MRSGGRRPATPDRVLTVRDTDERIKIGGQPHGSRLGKPLWVVERTISWLHNFRRLRIRFERLAFIHQAFLKLVHCIICWRRLKKSLERVAHVLRAGEIGLGGPQCS